MDRYISSKKLKRKILEGFFLSDWARELVNSSIDDVAEEDVAPVIHAHWWLELEPDGTPYCFHCSHCDSDGSIIGNLSASKYCPHCGRRMDEVKE